MKDEIQSFKNLVATNENYLSSYHKKIDDLREKLKDENLSDDEVWETLVLLGANKGAASALRKSTNELINVLNKLYG